MTQPAYPTRGIVPWDSALKEYIDGGDAAAASSGTSGVIVTHEGDSIPNAVNYPDGTIWIKRG